MLLSLLSDSRIVPRPGAAPLFKLPLPMPHSGWEGIAPSVQAAAAWDAWTGVGGVCLLAAGTAGTAYCAADEAGTSASGGNVEGGDTEAVASDLASRHQ